jgi:ATP-dependent exoDNAse (exonuclease V) alpha subunit
MGEIKLSPSQEKVVNGFPGFLLSNDTEMTISGPAGTGKTFLVQYLTKMAPAQQKMVQLLDPNIPDRSFTYTATTNKAAEVLRATVGQETSTIHRQLGLRVINDYKTGKQHLKAGNSTKRLSHTVVFVDEASMINDELARAIRGAIKIYRDCKLVFIGDKYQLPPVKEDVCSIFRPGAPNVYDLTEIHRQVAGSPIIKLATKYRDLLDNPSETWPEIHHDDETIFKYDDPTAYKNAIRKAYSKPHQADDYRVVAWSNKRVNEYNNFITRDVLGHTVPYSPGDRVTTNNPLFVNRAIVAPTDFRLTIKDAEWGRNTIEGYDMDGWWIHLERLKSPVFQPANWSEAEKLKKMFAQDKNWGPYFRIKEEWADLRPIHASTVHKAQGSTYREVFVDLADIGRNTRWRDLVRLMYVAVTRASHKVHIYGNIGVDHKVREAEDTLEAFQNVQQLL